MKRLIVILICLAAMAMPCGAALDIALSHSVAGRPTADWWSGATGAGRDVALLWARDVENRLEMSDGGWDYIYFDPTDQAMIRTEGVLRWSDANNCPEYWSGTGIVQLTSGTGDNTLDNAYDQGGAGAGRTITADTGAVTITNTDSDAAFLLAVTPTPGGAAATGGISIVTGGNSTEDSLQITNSGSGYSISTDSDKFTVTKAGAVSLASTLAVLDDITLQSGMTLDQGTDNSWLWTENSETLNWAFGSNQITLSSTSGVTSMDFGTIAPTFGSAIVASSGMTSSEDITLANGKAVRSSTTTAETMKLKVYDNDSGPAYVDAMTLTNGNTPSVSIGGNATTVAIDSTDWDISATGAMTGIGAITADGLITGTLGTTISGAVASLNANSNFATNICTGTSTGAITLGGGSGSFAVASTGLDISTAGALTNAVSIAGAGANALDLSVDNRFEFFDNSERFGIIMGTNKIELANCNGTGVVTIDFNDVDALEDIDTITLENGLTFNNSVDTRLEITEASDTFGIIFGSNKLELANCNGTGVVEIDFNDVDALSDVGSIAFDNALTMNNDVDGRLEITEASDTFGLIFGSNKIELASCNGTGITTIDFNDVDALEDIESVTGDGTGALGGFLKTVTNDTDGKILTVAESGTVQTNAGAGGAAAWTLPTAAAGLEYTFVVMAAQELRVTPAAGDLINYSGTAMDAAEYYTANAVGETLHIIAVDATNWIVISSTGTWTEETP